MDEKKIKKIVYKTEDLIDLAIRAVFVIVFAVGSLGMYDTWKVFQAAQDKSTLKYKPENGKVLTKELKDNVAWITLDDSKIDYPVMQGGTNEDYLNTDPYGNYSLSGSIFLDSRNSSNFSDAYNLVYGHHMSDEAMFGALDNWTKPTYYEVHKTGTLTTTSAIYQLDVIGIETVDASEDKIFQPVTVDADTSVNFINSLLNSSSDHILALSTCQLPESTMRTVLFCNMTLIYQGDVKITKEEPEETGIRVGNKVYSDITPVKPNKNVLDSLLKIFID